MQIYICDDHPATAQEIKQLVETYFLTSYHTRPTITTCHNPETLLNLCVDVPADIFFLDILMPTMNGIEAGQSIRNMFPHVPIVYLSISTEFALDSYSVHAFDYLLKPVNAKRLRQTLDRFVTYHEKHLSIYWPVKTADGTVSVPIVNLMYVEYQAHRIICFMKDNTVVTSNTMRVAFDHAVSSLKKQHNFIKVSASFLVNMYYIKEMRRSEFLMEDGKRISNSRLYKDAKKQYIDFLSCQWD